MELNLLTKNRTALMGFSILCIMLCHNSLIGNYVFEVINSFMRTFLQIGVDIFLLLSAIGCCYSYNKLNKNAVTFYKKRFSRILPTYIFIIFFYGIYSCVIFGKDVGSYIYRFSLISFYLSGTLVQWFISAILVLYLLFPICYEFYRKNRFGFYFLIIVVVLCVFIFSMHGINLQSLKVVNEIFFSRVPIFLLGIIVGDSLYSKKEVKVQNNKLMVITILLMLLVVANYFFNYVNMWVVMRLLFCPLSISLSLIISHLFDLIPMSIGAFNFLGGITLELYLIHEKMLGITYFVSKYLFSNEKYLLLFSNFLAIVLAVIAAVIVHKIVDEINKFIIN